jgi:hypothetical protein
MTGVGGKRKDLVIPHDILIEAGNFTKSVSIMLGQRSTKERCTVRTHGD